jgi:hypothetical protein
MTLTTEQIRFFHLNGFLAIPQPITTQEELAWMCTAYDRIFAERAGRDEGNQFDLGGADQEGEEANLPQILNPAKYAPELKDGAYLKTATEIVRQLLGPEVSAGIGHAIFKPAGHGAPTPWHQDEAYWDPAKSYESVSIWVPLQEATEDNGCMWFVPGSHRLEVLPHQSIGGDTRIHALEALGAITQGAISCPLPAGGATFHTSRTLPRDDGRRFIWNEIKQTARAARAAANI